MYARFDHLLKILLAGGLALLMADQSMAAHYELRVDSSNPAVGRVRLVLDSPLQSELTFSTRRLGSSVQIINPRCDEPSEELMRSDTAWTAPTGCSVISWTTRFEVTAEPSVDVSKQTNLYHPDGWWLFTEWNTLLRPEPSQENWPICAEFEGSESCRSVPSSNEPPLFMLIGEPQESVVLNGITFRFFVGHLPENFDPKDLYDAYQRQLSYLRSLITARDFVAATPREIDVLLLGIDATHGTIGGAAGNSAYLANVAISNGEVSVAEQSRVLWVSGHELSHLLGVVGGPVWASESLAHYYGFKSLGSNEQALEFFHNMADDTQSMGLLEAYRRLTILGEGQHYEFFYSRGAAFWKEIDGLISAATAGESDLDDFLPILRSHDFGAGGELPPEFTDSVGSIVGRKALDRILGVYL